MKTPLKIPPGIVADETSFAASGRWRNADKVRFWKGQPQVIGGWERVTLDAVTGYCRGILPFTDNAGALNIGLGTHSKLHVWTGGGLYDITPTLAVPATLLGTNPLTTVNTSPTVTVSHPHHGRTTGDSVSFSGASAFNNVTISGAYTITVTTADAYTITAGTNANASSAGGGSAVVAAPQVAFAAGSADGTGGSGYGAGAYGVGTYGSPSTADYFARTWALSTYGQSLIASPRGGTIYQWSNATGTPAAPLRGAPARVSYALATPQLTILALGCNQQSDGVFNPMLVRNCSIENLTDWAVTVSNTADETPLDGGGRLVAGRMVGQYVLIWSDSALYLGTFIGDPSQTYRYEKIAGNCGLIGPNAVVIVGQAAYWLGSDGQFYRYALGGAPEILPCDLRAEMVDNITLGQKDKIYASSTSRFAEVRWDYPDGRDGLENSRYVAVNTLDLSWTRGIMDRTAYVDAGPSEAPLAVDASGSIYWHETGQSADGNAFSWSIESADFFLNNAQDVMLVRGMWPDFKDQQGQASVSIISRMDLQGVETTLGPYSLPAGTLKSDFMVSGRLLRVKFAGSAAPTYCRIGLPVFDADSAGQF